MTPLGRKRFFNFKENKEKQEESDEFGRGRSNTITEHGVYQGLTDINEQSASNEMEMDEDAPRGGSMYIKKTGIPKLELGPAKED